MDNIKTFVFYYNDIESEPFNYYLDEFDGSLEDLMEVMEQDRLDWLLYQFKSGYREVKK